jgi:hypothetical protein
LNVAAAVADEAGVMHRSASAQCPDDAACIAEAAVRRRCSLVVECRESAWAAVPQGLDLAHRHSETATLAFAVPPFTGAIVAIPGLPVVSNDVAALEVACYGARRLDRACSEAQGQGVPSPTVEIEAVDVPGDVSRRAREEGVDVIVVACETVNAVVRLFNGSQVPGPVTAATVPLVMCRDAARAAPPLWRRARMRQGSRRVEAGGSPTLPPS